MFIQIFTDVTPILSGLSERETMCFGRFTSMVMGQILRWHSKEEIYKKVLVEYPFSNQEALFEISQECEGFPGCETKIRKKDFDEKPITDSITYDVFKNICYKWQVRLAKVK
jgi:hypothetical protein